MNLIAGVLFFSIAIARVGTPDLSTVIVASVSEGSPAAAAGLQENDIIREVNQQVINSSELMQELVSGSEGNPIELTLERSGQQITTQLVPLFNEEYERYMIGIGMTNPFEPVPFYQAIPNALGMAYEQAALLFKMPGMISRGEMSQEEARLLGPVSMGRLFADARERDIEAQQAQEESIPNQPTTELPAVNTVWLMGILSVALAITNLLPFPALDGGRILLLVPEIITRKRVPVKFENALNMIGFALLLVVMVLVTAQDIIRPIVLP